MQQTRASEDQRIPSWLAIEVTPEPPVVPRKLMSLPWRRGAAWLRDEAGRARVVCDYIAGMTDRFAIEEHRRLFHLDVWN